MQYSRIVFLIKKNIITPIINTFFQSFKKYFFLLISTHLTWPSDIEQLGTRYPLLFLKFS